MSQLEQHFMRLDQLDPTFIIDLRYATPNNVLQKALYPPAARCYLVNEAAESLTRAHQQAKKRGLRFKLFDAYRPLDAQKTFWSFCPDPRYVADPSVGSKHNRGCAIDLTLVDEKGQELDMGTDFDAFQEASHIDFPHLGEEARKNRQLLRQLMERHGFLPMHTEWWHFDWHAWEGYPLFNIPFET